MKISDGIASGLRWAGVLILLSLIFVTPALKAIGERFAISVPGTPNFVLGEIGPGSEGNPVVREMPVKIEPNQTYLIKVALDGVPEVHLDLMSARAADRYDRVEQEVILSRGKKDRSYRFYINSGDAPAEGVFFRIFYDGGDTIQVRSVELARMPAWYNPIRIIALIGFPIIGVLGVFAGLQRRAAKIAWALFIGAVLISGLLTRSPLEGDNRNYAMVAHSLLADGDIRLEEFQGRIRGDGYYGVVIDDGVPYNLFPLGPSLALIPNYWISNLGGSGSSVEKHAGRMTTALAYGTSVALFFLLATALGAGERRAVLLTMVFALCSHQLSQHLTQFWSHAAAMPFIVGSMLFAVRGGVKDAFFAAIFLCAGYLMRPTVALLAPIFLVWFLACQRERAAWYVLGGVVGALWVASINLTLYGHFVSPYSQLGRLGGVHFNEAIIGNLISPNRGLLIFIPWTVFSIIGGIVAFRSKERVGFYRTISIWIVAHYVLVSSFPHWWAGHSFGPRLLSELMPGLVLLLLPILDSSLMKKRWLQAFLGLMIAVAAVIQLAGFSGPSQRWNATPANVDDYPKRIWDWSDIQYLRPITRKSD